MEATAKIAAIEVHIDNIRRDIDRLETYISTVDKELDTYKTDLQEAISQCKGMTSQVAEISSELKTMDETIDTELKTMDKTIAVVKDGVIACERERKETIWKFIKENPEKSTKIFFIVLFIIFIFSLIYFDSISGIIAIFSKLFRS